ncbi:MAG TPA: MFS transporter [Terracidiphilus sp.]|nr:MFS transporter [Terracidiphilus sp.]
MSSSAAVSAPVQASDDPRGSVRHIASFVYFTFICYLSIGLPLAVLPPYVHLKMGYSAVLAGLVISIQYIATLASRPWAGRISDRQGAKISVLWGMAACTASGALLVTAAVLFTWHIHWLSVLSLIMSRLILGVGESLGSTGATLWGITATGPQSTAKVIGWNGISTYGAMALGAPLGVILDQQWGLSSLGFFTIAIGAVSLIIAARRAPVPVIEGEHLPFAHVLGRVAPHGMGLALGGVCYSVLATFITLYYASRHWNGAALCLTVFGLGFVLARLLFLQTVNRFGGFPVAMACLAVESLGLLLLWLSNSPQIALAGAALGGFGFSLVFPAIGVEAVKRVPETNRGAALGVYTAFADVSFFLVGPTAGAIIGWFGYRSVFLFALASVLAALGIVVVLANNRGQESGFEDR